jgi:SAM-dependent methyltransferase
MAQEALSHTNLRTWDGYQVPMYTLEVRRFVEFVSVEKPGSLLDVGCADGQLGEYLNHRLGWRSSGIDISLTNASLATQRGVMTVVGNLRSPLPFDSNSFDAVIAKQIIEHLVDTRLFLMECYRVLRVKGCLILGTPNLASLSNRLRLLLGRYPGWMDYQLEDGAGHVRYYSFPILKRQLRAIGFHVEYAVGTALRLPFLARFLPEDRIRFLVWLGRILPSLSPILVVKARKLVEDR